MVTDLEKKLMSILTEKQRDIVPENIRFDKKVFGVQGVAGKANIYAQRNEPTEKEGIWVQAKDLQIGQIMTEESAIKVDDWKPEPLMTIPGGFDHGTVNRIGDDVYLMGGVGTTKRLLKFNVVDKTFTQLSELPYPCYGHSSAVLGTDIYFGGYIASNYDDNFYKYDTLTDTYTKLTNLEGNNGIRNYYDGSMITVNNKLYVIGTWRNDNKVWRYDETTDTMEALSTIPFSTESKQVTAIGDYIYMFGGYNPYGDVLSAYKYDTVNDTFTQLKSLPEKMIRGAITYKGTDIYLFGGTSSLKSAYKYDTITDDYERLPDATQDINNAGAITVEDEIWVLGGSGVQAIRQFVNDYPNNTLFLKFSDEGYGTQLFNSDIKGRVINKIKDVWHHTVVNGKNDLLPTSYGDGEKWICFKNEDLLLPDEEPEEEEEIPLTVSYIESDGTQYIDTGIMPADDIEFEISFNHQGSVDTSHSAILGARSGYRSNSLVFFDRLSGNFNNKGIWIGGKEDITATTYTHYQVDTVATFKDSTLTLTSSQGTESHAITMPSAFTGSYGIILFGSRLANSIELAVKMRLYYCKIWKAGELVRDFVPHLQNGEYCLLDNVSGEVFLSPNGTSFTGHSERSAQVEYIQSLGDGEYIDTGVVPTANTEVEIQFEDTDPFINYERFFAINKQFGIMRKDASTTVYQIECGNSWVAGEATIPEGGIHTVKIGKNTVLVDGENSFSYSGSASTDKTLYLFQGNGTNEAGAFKLYYFKVWEDGTLVRDFVPYIVDDVYCLKDLVSGQYFYAQGGSPLIGGEPISVLDYTPLESVTLTKPFMTDYAPCSNTRVVLDYIDEDTTRTYYQNLIGASNGTRVNTQMLLQRVGTSNEWRAYFGTAGDYGHEVTMNDNIRYVFDWNKNNIYIDGMLGTTMTYNEWTAASGYYLAINPLNEGDCSTAFKVYSFKIYENDELVRDYVPASKDDTTGFYETVSGTYFDLSETEV